MAKLIIKSRTYGEKEILFNDSDAELLMAYKWYVFKHRNNFYAATNTMLPKGRKTKLMMHRLLNPSYIQCDHIDHNGLNNQRSNLRDSTHSQNQSNKRSAVNSSSKYLGVSWLSSRKKWQVQIRKSGINKHLGYSKNEHQAALIYNKAAKELHGEFANLNIIQTDLNQRQC